MTVKAWSGAVDPDAVRAFEQALAEIETLRSDLAACRAQLQAQQELLRKIAKETGGAPSMVLFDGQSYKAVPTALCDETERLAAAGVPLPQPETPEP